MGVGSCIMFLILLHLHDCSFDRRCPRVLNLSVTYCSCNVAVMLNTASSFRLVTTT